MREDDEGWACVGYTTTGYMGFSNWWVVFRCQPEHLQQHFSPIRLAVSAVFADDAVLGKFTGCSFVSIIVIMDLSLKFSTQTASRSLQSFLQGSLGDRPTDRRVRRNTAPAHIRKIQLTLTVALTLTDTVMLKSKTKPTLTVTLTLTDTVTVTS